MTKHTITWIENIMVELFVKRLETIILTVIGFIPFLVEKFINKESWNFVEIVNKVFLIFGLLVFIEIIYVTFVKKLKLKCNIGFISRPEYHTDETWKAEGAYLEIVNNEYEDIENCFVSLKELIHVDGDLNTDCLLYICGDNAPRLKLTSNTIKRNGNSERITICYIGVGQEPVLVFENGRNSKNLDKHTEYRIKLSLNGKRKDIDIYEEIWSGILKIDGFGGVKLI